MKRLLQHADILTLVGEEWKTLKNAYLGIDGDTICYLSATPPQERICVPISIPLLRRADNTIAPAATSAAVIRPEK